MGNWEIIWSWDKPSYLQGETASVTFYIESRGNTYIYISNIKLIFGFGTYNITTISGMVGPGQTLCLGKCSLSIPNIIVGIQTYRLRYHIYEYVNNIWVDRGTFHSNQSYYLYVYSKIYRVFVSRGLTVEDRAIGDQIVEIIKRFGFETVTVGIEKQVPNEEVPQMIREEIKNSDAVIAIATPRFIDALTSTWKTLEWLHAEVGIAFGIDKPLLILQDSRVNLGGLPSYLKGKYPVIIFNYLNLDELNRNLTAIMPSFREWIESKRMNEFYEILGKIFINALALFAITYLIHKLSGSTHS